MSKKGAAMIAVLVLTVASASVYFSSVPPKRPTVVLPPASVPVPQAPTPQAPTPGEPETAPLKKHVICYTAPGCGHCERWKYWFGRGIDGYTVEFREKPEDMDFVPQFDITDQHGRKYRHRGYLTIRQLRRLTR